MNVGLGETDFVMRARDIARSAQGDPGGFAASARHQAREILSGSQYQSRPERSFRPLAGVLGAIGRFFDRVFGPPWRFLEHHLFHPLSGQLSDVFGNWWPVLVLALVVVGGVLVGRVVIKRRSRPDRQVVERTSPLPDQDPDSIDALARQAELDGDLQRAVRLRFRAGVIRLERLGAVDRGPTRTDRQISERLNSSTFDALATDLESIVYGGSAATAEQAADAVSGWRTVTIEASRNLKTAESSSGAGK